MFSINRFLAYLNNGSIAKTTNFEVLVSFPGGRDSNSEYNMTMRIEAIEKPGRTVKVASDEIYHYGVPQKLAWGSSFADTTISVILSEDFRERDYFETWIDAMIGPYRKLVGNQQNMYDISYYDNYKGSVTINQYTETGELAYQLQLIDAIPVNIGGIALSWADGAQVAKLPVTFSYHRYIETSQAT